MDLTHIRLTKTTKSHQNCCFFGIVRCLWAMKTMLSVWSPFAMRSWVLSRINCDKSTRKKPCIVLSIKWWVRFAHVQSASIYNKSIMRILSMILDIINGRLFGQWIGNDDGEIACLCASARAQAIKEKIIVDRWC